MLLMIAVSQARMNLTGLQFPAEFFTIVTQYPWRPHNTGWRKHPPLCGLAWTPIAVMELAPCGFNL